MGMLNSVSKDTPEMCLFKYFRNLIKIHAQYKHKG